MKWHSLESRQCYSLCISLSTTWILVEGEEQTEGQIQIRRLNTLQGRRKVKINLFCVETIVSSDWRSVLYFFGFGNSQIGNFCKRWSFEHEANSEAVTFLLRELWHTVSYFESNCKKCWTSYVDTQFLTTTHAQLQRHRLKFIKKPYENSYMFRSTIIFRELQYPR